MSYADSLKKMTDLSSQLNTSLHTNKHSRTISVDPLAVDNNNTSLMVVIENIPHDVNNMDTLKLIFNFLKLNINTIINAKFKNRNAIITLNSLFSKDQLLFSTSLLINSKFNYLFIHPILSSDDMYFKKIAYHAIKNNLITGYKCVFNRRNKKFELRYILTNDASNKINWSINPFIPSSDMFITWEKSFDHYINGLKDNNSSSSIYRYKDIRSSTNSLPSNSIPSNSILSNATPTTSSISNSMSSE